MFAFYRRLTDQLDPIGDALMPTLSRLTFAGVLLLYFWNSGLTKLGDGFFDPKIRGLCTDFSKGV